MVLCEITEGSVTIYTYGHELISMNSAKEGIRYYLSDGHSDVRLLADEKGIITDIYLYDAYGVRLNHTGESENSMQYLGQQYDESTKLYNMRARYMSPDTGRFISMDAYQGSIYDPVSLHKYTYTSGNPVMYQDVSGYSEGKLENIAAGMTINMLLISAAVVYNSNILNQFTNFINYLDNEYKTFSAEIKFYISSKIFGCLTEITAVEKDIEDAITGIPAQEVTGYVEIFPEVNKKPLILITVPAAEDRIGLLITVPVDLVIPSGGIIGIPIPKTGSFGGKILTLKSDIKTDTNTYNNRDANKQAQKHGYSDAHELKKDYVGKSDISKFDMKYDKTTKEIILESKDGKIQVPTGLIHQP